MANYTTGVCPDFFETDVTYLLSSYTMDYELTFRLVSKCNTHLAETKTYNPRITLLEFFRYDIFVT